MKYRLNFTTGLGIGMMVSGLMVWMFGKEAPHKCEFTVPYMVYPALTIKCEEPGRPPCDTIYTYADWGSR